MSTTTSTPAGRAFGYADLAAMLVGLAVFGYGLLLVPLSALGGLWIAAVGLSLALAGLFNTRWVGDRFGLSPRDRRSLTVAFTVLSAVLLVSFVVVGGFGVTGPTVSEGFSSGSG